MESQKPVCGLCSEEIAENEIVTCSSCNTSYHKICVQVNDNMLTWKCAKCSTSIGGGLQVPNPPKTNRSRSIRSGITSNGSKAMEIELMRLEEERQMLQRSLDEKASADREFIRKKYEVLQLSDSINGSIKSRKSSVSKVKANPETVDQPQKESGISKETVDDPTFVNLTKKIESGNTKSAIQQLQEEREALHKSIDEKTLLDREYIQKKYDVMQSRGSRCGSIKSQVSSNEKVESWIRSNNFHSNHANIPKPDCAVENEKNLNVHHPKALLSSTKNQSCPEVIKQSRKVSLHAGEGATFTVPNPIVKDSVPRQDLPIIKLSSNAISARHVVSKDLPEFDGTSRKWSKFISAFNHSTQLCEINEYENYNRLEKCLKGKAYEVVQNILFLPGGLPNVISTLTNYFGRPEFVINELLEDLRKCAKPKSDDIQSIIEFALHVENLCAVMKSASLSEHLWNPTLLQELVDYLPMSIKCEWASYKYQKVTNVEVFGMWMREKADMLLGVLKVAPFRQNSKLKGNINFHASENKRYSCVVCEESCVKVQNCPKFIKMGYGERWNTVKSLSLCRSCLTKHLGKRCQVSNKCGVDNCTFRHNSLLHKTAPEEKDSEVKENSNIIPDDVQVSMHHYTTDSTLFKILPVTVSFKNKSVDTFAMLDDGCSLTLVHQSVADDLGASGKVTPLCLRWTANMKREEMNSMEVSLQIAGKNGKQFSLSNVRTVEKLNLPKQSLSASEIKGLFKHLKDLPIPSYFNAEPKMLIGLTHAKLLVNSKVKSGLDNEPVAAKTKLGWTVFGSQSQNEAPVFHICECQLENKMQLDTAVKTFFELENSDVRQPDSTLSKEEKNAIKQLEINTCFKGRFYETSLLWKFKKVALPNSFNMALNRWNCLESRCKRDPDLRVVIQSQIDDYINKGYARKLNNEEIESTESESWYLPIFAVRNPNKPSKVRIVWDAAAEVKGISLNSVLLKGPDNLASLSSILRRFREGKFAVTGDIKEMFHQIHIRKKDQNFQRFLWSSSPSKSPDVYVMEVMTFGATCSPATAQFIKNLNANKFVSEFPLAVNSIINNHYVDDFLDAADSEEEVISLSKSVKWIHSQGGFHIRNWTSNSRTVLNSLEGSADEKEKSLELTQTMEIEKVLGLWWNTTNDCFTYSLKLNKANLDCIQGKVVPSKREILRAVMSVFDPLGFLSHFLIFPKILLQEIWRCGLSWDEKISEEQDACWKEWVSSLSSIETLNIPRWMGTTKKSTVELHTFVDAGEDAYAAAVYVRHVSGDKIQCWLVSAKSRVAPLKPISIPRLELLAATIGCRLAATVRNDLCLNVSRSFFWSDSRTVLSWIKSDARKYKQFVGFRVADILEKSLASEWRWVPTLHNTADMATRKKVINVDYDSEWFQGPSFLYNDESLWPESSITPNTMEEIRPKHCVQLFFHEELEVERFSDYRRLRRTQAYVLRFINNLKVAAKLTQDVKFEDGPITKAEYIAAQNCLFRKAQSEGFPDEVACFKIGASETIHKSSPIFKDAPFKDEYEVLRASTRLAYDDATPYDVKFPVLLPREHYITKLIMMFFHRKYHHINKETVVNEISQRYVIARLRSTLNKIAERCQHCKNKRATPCSPMMSSLPLARTVSFTRPFTFVGVDLFGPLYVVVRRSHEKRWGVLFTCLSIRAVHIEITSSLSADSFILSLDCFISRRGMPNEIYCDNGTNLRGASSELKSELENLDFRTVQEKYNSETLEFIFNPPAAPHMGGAWERLVRSVKTTLKAVNPIRTPTDDLLKSLMSQVENMVNSRPLTYIPISSENDEPLTPNHFLLGSSSGVKPLGASSENSWIHRKNWLKSQEYANRLWVRWRKEYLPTIRRRTKWFTNQRDLAVGDIVLLLDDDIPRNLWPKAKVLSVSASRDGKVRRATVQTSKGIYDRPVVKLAVLDIFDKDGTSNTSDTSMYRGGVLRGDENIN